jgi:hypothetical protein
VKLPTGKRWGLVRASGESVEGNLLHGILDTLYQGQHGLELPQKWQIEGHSCALVFLYGSFDSEVG